jgi:pimeloyl-ACP methyl ester carboxylesterase
MKRAALVPKDLLPELPDLVPGWPGEPVEVDGSVTFVRRTPPSSPNAEPALYIHGLGGSSLNWTDFAYLAAGVLDAEAIDLPGFGLSDPGRSYSVAALADRVIRWIEYSGRGAVHLVGNSLGGSIGVRIAGLRPDLVRTLTLVSPAMPFIDPRRSLQSRLVPLTLIPGGEWLVARRLATVAPETLAQEVIDACFADPATVSRERLLEAVEEVRQRYTAPWYVAAYLRTLRGLATSFLRAYLPGDNSMWRIAKKITAPTLVVGGRYDKLVDIRVAPVVADLIRDSRLLMLDGVGHVAQMEQPALVARGVLALLAEAKATAAARAEVLSPVADTPRNRRAFAAHPMQV